MNPVEGSQENHFSVVISSVCKVIPEKKLSEDYRGPQRSSETLDSTKSLGAHPKSSIPKSKFDIMINYCDVVMNSVEGLHKNNSLLFSYRIFKKEVSRGPQRSSENIFFKYSI